MSLTLQHIRKTILTNHKTACPDLAAYHIYMHVLLALSPKMAPINKKHEKSVEARPCQGAKNVV